MVNILLAFPSWIAALTCSVGQHSLLHRKFQDPDMQLAVIQNWTV